jgi:hypothetical protein
LREWDDFLPNKKQFALKHCKTAKSFFLSKTAAAWQNSLSFEIPRMLVCLAHVARFTVNLNYSIV